MSSSKASKIKPLLDAWQPHTVATSEWLGERGINPQDVRNYLASKWLVSLGRGAFMIAALVSHKRPVIELIRPTPKDQRDAFKAKFDGMTLLPFSYDDHVATLERLVHSIRSALNEDDRAFLHSFEAGEPAWDRFPFDGLAELPAPQFKLLNIRRFRQEQPERHAASLAALESY